MTEFQIGDRVVYVPWEGATPEHGVVTSAYGNPPDAFVRFDGTDWSRFIPAGLLTEETS